MWNISRGEQCSTKSQIDLECMMAMALTTRGRQLQVMKVKFSYLCFTKTFKTRWQNGWSPPTGGALHSFLLRPPWPSGLDCFCEALIPKLHLELPFTRYFVVVEKQKYFAQRGARTHDPEIKSLMLYRLS